MMKGFRKRTALTVATVFTVFVLGIQTASAAGDAAYNKAKDSFEKGNLREAAKWLEMAVSQGHQAAQLPLAAMYRDGHGVRQDYQRALALFRRAARFGYPSAQFSLGVMYRMGEGVEKDYVEALKWYRKAARQGDPEAQNSLGVMNESGRGTDVNVVKAFMWYEISATNGDHRGKLNMRRLGKKLSREELDTAMKFSQKCIASNYRNCG